MNEILKSTRFDCKQVTYKILEDICQISVNSSLTGLAPHQQVSTDIFCQFPRVVSPVGQTHLLDLCPCLLIQPCDSDGEAGEGWGFVRCENGGVGGIYNLLESVTPTRLHPGRK